MSFVNYVPLIAGVVLAIIVLSVAPLAVPPSKISSVTIRVGYPNPLDESDVADMWAYSEILAPQGINVVPTHYDSPAINCRALISGQQDIVQQSSPCLWTNDLQGQQLTAVASYVIGPLYIMVAGDNITSPQQLAEIGATVEDFGPGSVTRAFDLYWLKSSNITTQTVGPKPGTVYLRPGGDTSARVYDLMHGIAQAVTVDYYTLITFSDPSINNTAHHGPFHVLFQVPSNILLVGFFTTDKWLSNPTNQQVLVKFIAALLEAQRYFISNPQAAVTYMKTQLPITDPAEIEWASTHYPAAMLYWPYGKFNLQGNMSVQTLFQNNNKFFLTAGIINQPLANSSVPFGVINGYFERLALEKLGPFMYPCQPWVTPQFAAKIQAWVPSWMGGVSSQCSSGVSGSSYVVALEWLFNIGLQNYSPTILLSEGTRLTHTS